VDCNITVHEEAEYLMLIDKHPSSAVISLSPTTTSAALARIYGDINVARVNLLSGFFPIMQTVEFAPTLAMTEEHKYQVVHFLESLGLQTEEIQDVVGFVTPRIVAMLVNEAAFTVMEETASIRDIDLAMKLGTNYPLGPLQWADEIGVDVVVAILDALYADYHQERYRVCRLLRQYVSLNLLGKSIGAGFYSYNSVH
jgi:3-hydroxybutyryl-CoA dehydrogenase